MKNLIRPLAALGVLASLAAASSASITFTGLSLGSLSNDGAGVINFKPGVAGSGTNTISGSYTVTSTSHLTDVDVTIGSNIVRGAGATLSFVSTITAGPTIYSQSVTSTGGIKKLTDGSTIGLSLASYVVNFTLSYAGAANVSFTQATFTFHDAGSTPPPPVPEPASIAALGVGAIGLIARRKKGAN